MRDLFFKLFEPSHFNTGIKITPFSGAHIVYLILFFGGIFLTAYLLRNKDMQAKEKVLRFLAYALVFIYLSDFFIHDFSNAEPGTNVGAGMNMDKLPFHLCVVLCPVIAFTQFNKKFDKFKEPVAVLAIVGTLMYLCYPASVGSGEPWCYTAVQTMLFHGIELAWGCLCILFGKVKLDIKNCWKVAVGLGLVTIWAKFGNAMLDYNWFFLEADALYLGLVENGIIPKWSLMIITPTAVFLISLMIYGINYAVKAVVKKMDLSKMEAMKN